MGAEVWRTSGVAALPSFFNVHERRRARPAAIVVPHPTAPVWTLATGTAMQAGRDALMVQKGKGGAQRPLPASQAHPKAVMAAHFPTTPMDGPQRSICTAGK